MKWKIALKLLAAVLSVVVLVIELLFDLDKIPA